MVVAKGNREGKKDRKLRKKQRTFKQAKTMDNFEKQQIAKKANEKKTAHNLSNQDIAIQTKVSASNISNMLGKTEGWRERQLSDTLWAKMAKWCGYSGAKDGWQFIPTKTSNKIMKICTAAQDSSIAVGVCGRPGIGKSESLKQYLKIRPKNTWYIECRQSWKQRTFVSKLAKAIGVETRASSVSGMEDDIIDFLNRKENPVIMIDEIQELTEGAFRVLKTIFNGTEFHCGFVYCGGLNFQKRMRQGLDHCKQSYEEIYSRMGGEIKQADVPAPKDIINICKGNISLDKPVMHKIINESDGDLRLLRRKVVQHQKLAAMAS